MSDEINEITEGHSDYKPADTRDENVKHQLTGMYQNWFLDYASYVILERAVPHINDGLKSECPSVISLISSLIYQSSLCFNNKLSS